jgi:hypothetical protein
MHAEMSWYSKKFEWNDALKESVPLDKEHWTLIVDGAPEEIFESEADLKCFIIRFVYDIEKHMLIPSELLHDAQLSYITSEWIDTWTWPGHIKVIQPSVLAESPAIRNIVLEDRCYTPQRRGAATQWAHAPGRNPTSPTPVSQPERWRSKKSAPQEPLQVTEPWPRTGLKPGPQARSDSLDLTVGEETAIWCADAMGAGLDEFDTLDDDDCVYPLVMGVCDGKCQEAPASKEKPISIQAKVSHAAATKGAPADDVDGGDYFRYG